MFRLRLHKSIYFAGLLLAAFLLPVSVWLLSVVSIILSANWLMEGKYRRKIRIIRSRRGLPALLALFAIYIVWLLNTDDFSGAAAELKLKLPLLFFPLILGSSERTGDVELRLVLLSFIAGCLFSTVAGFLALTGALPAEISGPRDLALFLPSIRLSILLCFGIFSSLWLMTAGWSGGDHRGRAPGGNGQDQAESSPALAGRDKDASESGTTIAGRIWARISTRRTLFRAGLAAAAAAMSLFLFRLLSVTGIVLFIILLGITGIYLLSSLRKSITALRNSGPASQESSPSLSKTNDLLRKTIAGLVLLAAAVALSAAALFVMRSATDTLHNPENPALNEALSLTASGNRYTHYPEETLIENGYKVWMNLCEEELRKEWDEKSSREYDGKDAAGNELRVTLIRYITALGMAKDSAAVAALAEADISNIEKGIANPIYARMGSPRARAYELAWELDRSASGANPSGHSLTQRPEFYRAAAGIIKKHPWAGVGTGDVARAFSEEYASNLTPLKPEYRLRAHNQYLTFGVTFGIAGAMLAVILILLPWLTSGCRRSYLFLLFMTVILVSMFNDDTFSSFTGAAFFSYFYTLLIITSTGNETRH